MAESNHEIVHVDASIELKDYFHAYIDSVKTSLVVAAIIVTAVIAGFSYFFILIGEQAILWKLSPLFFGVPIVALAGQLLRVHALYRKHLGNLSESEKNVHYMFPEKGDGLDIVRGKDFGHIAWESIRRVIERPRYFHFVLSPPDSFIIPKRFLRADSDEKKIREILRLHIGNKAKLLRD